VATHPFETFCALHLDTELVALDLSRLYAPDVDAAAVRARLATWAPSCEAMRQLEAGAVANPDENRMVGHYWLRASRLAPNAQLRGAIEDTLDRVQRFAADVHKGRIAPQMGGAFDRILVIGIGGSALGPQFMASALTSPHDRLAVHFFDNTDPDGIDRTLDQIGVRLSTTLTLVISKSGGTKETRNGMIEAAAAYHRAGLDFARHAIAVTGEGSELDRVAKARNFLGTFPMWDWVGGRTSVFSAVGLLPAALQGLDIADLLAGAAAMDDATRSLDPLDNPAAWLAFAWHEATGGAGARDMVVLPYKDRLELFSRYLQQLVMESLGKQFDLAGREVCQGIAVYGNKGSTDQHAYVQQLRDGVRNFFVTFIEVLQDRQEDRPDLEVEPGITSGDYLSGFLQGTRTALTDAGRPNLTLTVHDCGAHTIGALIALYDRAVGLYAHRVGINAYHQPGVEAGKKAAQAVIDLQHQVVAALRRQPNSERTLADLAAAAGTDDLEAVFWILRHLSGQPHSGVDRVDGDPSPAGSVWEYVA